MNYKIIFLITFLFSSMFLFSCGRKAEPINPSDIVLKN
jgi:hypothetical protein